MQNREQLIKQVDFAGWVALEALLRQDRDTKIGLLLSAESEKQADKVRGAITYIDTLLALKSAALRAANERT